MNSRNFIITVAFVISFFAACFAWETRSVLPEGNQNDVSVGACITGYRAVNLENACSEIPVAICDASILHNYIYILECGCTVCIPIWQKGCFPSQSDTGCEPKDGKTLVIDESGGNLLEKDDVGCGDHATRNCEERYLQTNEFTHSNCPEGQSGPVLIDDYECIGDAYQPTIIRSCGSLSKSKGC